MDSAFDVSDALHSNANCINAVGCEDPNVAYEWFYDDDGFTIKHNDICPYIQDWMNKSKLHILKPKAVSNAYKNNDFVGLVRQFMPRQLLEVIREWTNANLQKKVCKSSFINEDEFNAYFGLEIAMSLVKMNRISDYWSTSLFQGHQDFKRVMSRDRFKEIRAALKFRPDGADDMTTRSTDPLWFARSIINKFQKCCAKVAVPIGVSALDENSTRTKARTAARSYMPSKPDKYAIRFYAVCGWKSTYLHSIWDNGSGNKSNIPPANRYACLFPELRTPFIRAVPRVTNAENVLSVAPTCTNASTVHNNGNSGYLNATNSSQLSSNSNLSHTNLSSTTISSSGMNVTTSSMSAATSTNNEMEVTRLESVVNVLQRNDVDCDPESATALWLLQMAHQVICFKSPSGKRLFCMDNLYTRHTLGKCLKQITDGEARILGTVRPNLIDATNRVLVMKALEMAKSKERGQWILVSAYDKHEDVQKLKKQHVAAQKKIKNPKERVPFKPTHGLKAEYAGYIIFIDKKPVIFYTNDLKKTPPEDIMHGEDERAQECVHGVCTVHRWTGSEYMYRTQFQVAAPIAAYNIFMNAVDRMDQRRIYHPTRRSEKRVTMTLWTYIIDLCCHNAYAVLGVIDKQRAQKTDFREFKRCIVENLVMPFLQIRTQKQCGPKKFSSDAEMINANLGADDSFHYITTNKNGTALQCYLCRIVSGETYRSTYGCSACQKAFHVNCYTAFHFRNALKGNNVVLNAIALASDDNSKLKTRKRKVSMISDIQDLTLFCQKKQKK